MVKQCRQCTSPLCVYVCPTGACQVDTANGNVRTIDESKCISCKKCLEACPYQPAGIVWNFNNLKAIKCDLCLDTPYFDQTGGPNGKQACVVNCPQQVCSHDKQLSCLAENPGYEKSMGGMTQMLLTDMFSDRKLGIRSSHGNPGQMLYAGGTNR
jgi:Fe-S-cluster-containing dehydrogenase component